MLQPYTDYTFKVQAVSAIGDGPTSKSVSFKTYGKYYEPYVESPKCALNITTNNQRLLNCVRFVFSSRSLI